MPSISFRLCKGLDISDLYWLTDEQQARRRPHFPKSHGKPKVNDRRVQSGIISVNRNGRRWRDSPPACGTRSGYAHLCATSDLI